MTDAGYLQGVNALKDQKLDDAVTFLRKSIEKGPELPTGYYYYLGVTWERKNDPAQAEAAFEKALEIKPGYAQAHSSLGLLYWRRNDRSRAMKEFQQAVMCDPDLAEAHYNLGLALAQSGNLDESIPKLTDAISLNPKYTDARVQLGLVLSQKNDTRRFLNNRGVALAHFGTPTALEVGLQFSCHFTHPSAAPVRASVFLCKLIVSHLGGRYEYSHPYLKDRLHAVLLDLRSCC